MIGPVRLAALAALALAGLAAPARAQETVASIYEAAKKEGRLVVWSSRDVAVNEFVGKLFKARYPGVELELVKFLPAPAIERLVNERKAGLPGADIVDPNISFMPLLLDRDLALSYDWSGVFGVDAGDVLFDGRAVVIGHYDQPLSFNTNFAKPEDIKSWDVLFDPKWSGRVLVESFAYSFGMLASSWGEERTFAFLDKVLANHPIVTNSPTNTAEALAGGQGAIAVGAYASRIQTYKEQGAPVDWARIGPIPAQRVVNVAIKGGPHPNAAKLWTAFWTTPEAQKAFYEVQRYGKIAGPTLSPRGEEVKKLGLEVVLESTDVANGIKWLDRASRTITGRK
jgi:iron(III) transport system substrate-binding protein